MQHIHTLLPPLPDDLQPVAASSATAGAAAGTPSAVAVAAAAVAAAATGAAAALAGAATALAAAAGAAGVAAAAAAGFLRTVHRPEATKQLGPEHVRKASAEHKQLREAACGHQ